MKRLDVYLMECGMVASRNKACELIKNAFVKVDSVIITKPSFLVSSANNISITKEHVFVSRAGDKLHSYVQKYNLDFTGLHALDIGSSKGGFTQALLQYGASSVTCVDVGSDQLDLSLRGDSRVSVFENCDIRDFCKEYTGERFDFVVCDVSFISLAHIIEAIKALSKGESLLLFKPQFEVGRAIKRNKKGVVQDKQAVLRALCEMLNMLESHGLHVVRKEYVELKGKNGSEEIFVHIKK